MNSNYSIIGSGRLSKHLARYFSLLNLSFFQWNRRQELPLQEAVKQWPLGSTVLLALSDSAIEPFINENPCLRNFQLVHFSGSLFSELAFGCHPLSTFSEQTYELETYRSLSFVVDEPRQNPFDKKMLWSFENLLPDLTNSYFVLSKEKKPLYHALCVLAGNGSMIIWRELFRRFESDLNLPAETALPYLKQTFLNTESSWGEALTGPIVRGDVATLERDLEALTGSAFREVLYSLIEAQKRGIAKSNNNTEVKENPFNEHL